MNKELEHPYKPKQRKVEIGLFTYWIIYFDNKEFKFNNQEDAKKFKEKARFKWFYQFSENRKTVFERSKVWIINNSEKHKQFQKNWYKKNIHPEYLKYRSAQNNLKYWKTQLKIREKVWLEKKAEIEKGNK